MVFSSVIFLFYFLPLFLLVYFSLPRHRAGVIVGGSFLFYAWGEPAYVLLLAVSILLNWAIGLALGRRGGSSRAILALGVAANLSFLVFFKYIGFLCAQFDLLLGLAGMTLVPVPHIPLPLGISFFTFQGISYLIDIARGDVAAQPSLLKYAMYKSMFPQLIAGPIVRYRQIAAEMDDRTVTLARLHRGIGFFVRGLAEKVLVANMVAGTADQVFALPADQLTPAIAWLGAACYAIQILFDFSGYSNMAIGLGHMMGFSLPQNFNRPYIATSVTEFWRRWHMSLSSWFRDYLYIPLGGNRRGAARTYANLLIVFALCGLWHGASWTFVIWGLYHGVFLIAERAMGVEVGAPGWRPLRHAYLLVVVLAGWVIFRAESFHGAAIMLRAMAGFSAPVATAMPLARYATHSVMATLLVAAIVIAAPWQWPGWTRWRTAPDGTAAFAIDCARIAGTLSLFVLAAAALTGGTYNPFIYFRF